MVHRCETVRDLRRFPEVQVLKCHTQSQARETGATHHSELEILVSLRHRPLRLYPCHRHIWRCNRVPVCAPLCTPLADVQRAIPGSPKNASAHLLKKVQECARLVVLRFWPGRGVEVACLWPYGFSSLPCAGEDTSKKVTSIVRPFRILSFIPLPNILAKLDEDPIIGCLGMSAVM